MIKKKDLYLSRTFVVLSVIILCLSGCSNQKVITKGLNSRIIPAELSASEKQLLNAIGVENYFVFRVSLPKGEKGFAHYWVDYYQNGVKKKLIDGKTAFQSLGDNGDKVVLATLSSDPDAKVKDWIISYISNGGFSRLKAEIPMDKNGASTSASTLGTDIIKDKPVILAVITQNHSSSTMIPKSVFEGEDTALKNLLSTNESVYIFCFELNDNSKSN